MSRHLWPDLIDAHPDPDIPDSYYIEYDPNAPWQQYPEDSEFGDQEGYEDPGSAAPGQEGEYWDEQGGEYGYEGGEGGEEEGYGEGDDDDGETDGGGYDQSVLHVLILVENRTDSEGNWRLRSCRKREL